MLQLDPRNCNPYCCPRKNHDKKQIERLPSDAFDHRRIGDSCRWLVACFLDIFNSSIFGFSGKNHAVSSCYLCFSLIGFDDQGSRFNKPFCNSASNVLLLAPRSRQPETRKSTRAGLLNLSSRPKRSTSLPASGEVSCTRSDLLDACESGIAGASSAV